jgi:hypothetical protein
MQRYSINAANVLYASLAFSQMQAVSGIYWFAYWLKFIIFVELQYSNFS